MGQLIRQDSKIIKVTLAVTASSAYSSGQQVGGLNRIPDALSDGGYGILQSAFLVDKAKQKVAMTVWLFQDAPTLASADADSFDLTDAQAAANLIGTFKFAASDYQDSSSNSLATVVNLGLMLHNASTTNLPSGASKRDIWAVLMTTGTPTYVSTSDLVLGLGIIRH